MYGAIRPLLFSLDPARAHHVAMWGLAPVEHLAPVRALVRAVFKAHVAPIRAMGLVFPTCIGVAGGFDKNGERALALAALGFGHVEVGTVTAVAQDANPAPNLFRLPADRALVNRLGFPNQGARVVCERLASRRVRERAGVPIGVSIGKSRVVPVEDIDAVIDDYTTSFDHARGVADFVVVNVSSPNTKNLRALQAPAQLGKLLGTLRDRGEASGRRVPILVKLAPDLTDAAVDEVCDVVRGERLAGVVATNTTTSRAGLETPADAVERIGAGGLSGAPLFARSVSVVRNVRARLGAGFTVIGVGGISSTEQALTMLRAGADLLQMYTGFVYEGPGAPRTIARGVARALSADGEGQRLGSTMARIVSTM
ncbi:MAG: quinone-dependent dihydroorotate dehydrogenase [Polyangiaceae bacterium]